MLFCRGYKVKRVKRGAGGLVPKRGVQRRAAGHLGHAFVLHAAFKDHSHAGLRTETFHSHVYRGDPAVGLHCVVASPDKNRVHVLESGRFQGLAAPFPAYYGGAP